MSSNDDYLAPLQVKTLCLMHGDLSHAIDRVCDKRGIEDTFQYSIPRELLVNEVKRMMAWLDEHDLNREGYCNRK